MKLDEEAIGGRKGYLQRIVGEDVPSIRNGSAQGRVEESLRHNSDGGESSGPEGTGERDGVGAGGYPGDSGRRARPNNTRQLLVDIKAE